MGNGYYLIDPTHKVQNVSFTNSTIYNYNGDQLFHPETASDDVFTFVFNNNTVYKCGSNSRTGMLFVDNTYNNTLNTFTFKDNIFWDKYGTGEAHVFYSKTGAGTVIQKNNVLHTYTAEWNTGTNYTKDYSNLNYTGSIPFYDADNHNFGIHPSHTLATASTTGGVVGDPRWLIVCINEESNYTNTAQSYAVVELTRNIAANKWATIVLPFDLASSQIETVFGTGTSVVELTNESDANTLNFTTTLTDSKMKANQPYAIKVTSDFSSATINGVTIVEDTPTQSLTYWDFVGKYETSTNIPGGSWFFSSNKLYRAKDSGTPNTIKGTRAYFTPKSSTPARDLTFSVDGGETTSIANLNVNDNANFDNNAPIFNLAGQRVGKNYKGIVIMNGKKVVIK
jgi:hypothetical protein